MRPVVVDAHEPVTAATRRAIRRADGVVDAMFGTGWRGALDGAPAELVELTNASGAPVVAVDIPSGVDGATGATRGPAIRADRTVTFAATKPGLLFHPGRALAGEVTVADIGIDVTGLGPSTAVLDTGDAAAWLPVREPTTHKWRSGVLVIGGSAGMAGAPLLAARAALRAGAGIVWAAVPAGAAAAAGGGEVIVRGALQSSDGTIAAGAAAELVSSASRFRAVVLGPGIGRGADVGALVRGLLAELSVPVVLDADGLVALAGAPEVLASRRAPTILTPHDGEFAAMTGAPPGPDRLDAARTLAARTGSVVLLKGPTTVVAEPTGSAWVNPTGTPDLATAGSGDVLSGVIAAFVASGTRPGRAAAVAAFVHGAAAERAAATGLLAGELPALIARTVRSLGADSIHT
jgi:NAD(P)H-hydrate epimerase